jgi:hypothetical protein
MPRRELTLVFGFGSTDDVIADSTRQSETRPGPEPGFSPERQFAAAESFARALPERIFLCSVQSQPRIDENPREGRPPWLLRPASAETRGTP